MPIAIFFVAFTGAFAVALLYPHLRALASALVLLFGTVLGFVIWDQVTQSARAPAGYDPGNLTLTDLETVAGPRFVEISGRAENGDWDARLRSFELHAVLYDCPAEDSALADCAAIADDTGLARVDIPPGQTRTFETVLQFLDTPAVRGVPRWVYEVGEIRATP